MSWLGKVSTHGLILGLITDCLRIMAIPVVEFSREGHKIKKVFGLKSTYAKEIIEFLELD